MSYSDKYPNYYAMAGPSLTVETLYAQWALNQTITFSKNSSEATGTMSNQTINGNSKANLTANSYNRLGYAFASLNTEPDGSGISYSDKGEYSVSADNTEANVTLYAQWDKLYTITFNLGSNTTGIVFDSTTYTNGQTTQVRDGKNYYITGIYGPRCGFYSWSATAGDLEHNNYPTTKYMVVNDATITLTGQESNKNMVSMANIGSIGSNCKNDPITPQLVYDPRDNETYWVAKLCDGNTWMLDNLRLNLNDSNVINSLDETNTNASNVFLEYLKNGGGDSTNQYPSGKLNGRNWVSSYTYSAPLLNSTSNNTLAPIIYGRGTGKIGIFYNYCAASAGSFCWGDGGYTTNAPRSDPNTTISPTARDIEADICPKGWYIPTGGVYNSATGAGDIDNLYSKYSGAAINQLEAFRESLSLSLVGNVYRGSLISSGVVGGFGLLHGLLLLQ